MVEQAVVPVLTGPTATGKTELSLRLGEEFPIEVVSADASMVYRGMDIGTAKPSLEERRRVPHHLLDVVLPSQPFSVADYVERAEAAISEVLSRGAIPLVVGGTGYYIRALSEGLHELPPPHPGLQAELWRELEERGMETLLAELEASSPADARRVGRNPRRLVRALEVLRRTGVPPAQLPRRQPAFRYRKLVLWPDWAWLEPRIARRVERMFAQGLVEEVAGLLRAYPRMSTALQAIGYKEVAAYLRGDFGLAQAREAVFQATRAYARRQYTWFRKEPGEPVYLPWGGEEAWAGVRGWFTQGPWWGG